MVDGDYYEDGVPMDEDNHPAASEGYNARRFGDPEKGYQEPGAADMMGYELTEAGRSSEDRVLERIEP